MKKIVNIVFYQFYGSNNSEKQACIFYSDGTFARVSFAEGIDACEEICRERNIQTKNAFRDMINTDLVHVMSGADFERRFSSFFATEDSKDATRSTEIKEEVKDEEEKDEDKRAEYIRKEANRTNEKIGAMAAGAAVAGDAIVENAAKKAQEDIDKKAEEAIDEIEEEKEAAKNDIKDAKEEAEEDLAEEEKEEEKKESKEEEVDTGSDTEEYDEDDNKEPKGFFARAWKKIKESKLVKRIILCVTAIGMALGIYALVKKPKQGTMTSSNIPGTTIENNTDTSYETDYIAASDPTLNKGSNDYYNDYTFDQLQAVTTSRFQQNAMGNIDLALTSFNGSFAQAWLEEGKDIRAALKFEEIVALQNAYNSYTKDQLRIYFNGADVDAATLSRNYKSGTLQLMGAHIIESSEHPVDMSMLIDSKEGKEFYNKYHDLFLRAKEAKGEEKIRLVKEFYAMVRADFYLTDEDRTTGISHTEIHDIEPYKLSVTPMIAAGEMLFQNLRVDETLNDKEVEFFNSVGLCNIADAHFRRIETTTLSSVSEDDKLPLYEQYRKALIGKYEKLGIYFIDDAHRELSQLERFKREIDPRYGEHLIGGPQGGKPQQPGKPETHTETQIVETVVATETETETHTEHTEEEVPESEVPEDIREELQQQVDQELEQENEEAQQQAEQEAQQTQQEMQQQEDEHAAQVEQEVAQDEQQLQQDIEDANEQIDENHDDDPTNDEPVNEDDFGDAQVDFDDDHSDEQGNLDDSVQDITTDPTGDQSDEPMPDPEQTGAEFDANQPPAQEGGNGQEQPENPSTGTEGGEEFWVEEEPRSNSAAVDAYLASLENQQEEEHGYQYTRRA